MRCQIDEIRGYRECYHRPYANITIDGEHGSVRIDVCETHFTMLTEALPTKETELAEGQKSGRIPIPEYE